MDKQILDEQGARRLIAGILERAYKDYTINESCPEYCPFCEDCEDKKKIDEKIKKLSQYSPALHCNQKEAEEAKSFIHSAWCAALCDGIEIDHETYVRTCIKNRRLSKNTYRYVLSEIKNYKENKKELNKLKNDLILETPQKPEGPQGNQTGDPTLKKVIKISLDKQIRKLEKVCNATEKIYNELPSDKKKVMENIWQGQYTNNGLANKSYVDEKTIRRWKQQIVYLVAIELKYL